jgi:hypothetical protein
VIGSCCVVVSAWHCSGMLRGAWWYLVLLGAAWRCGALRVGAWGYLVVLMVLEVLGGAGGAWRCMAVQRVWFVPLGAARRCLVMLGGAWWCLVVLCVGPCCLALLSAAGW